MTVALLVGLGLLVGFLLGLLGAGGSILAVPALVYLVGLAPREAIPLALAVVAISATAATVPRLRTGEIRYPLVAVFAITGAIGAVASTALGARLSSAVTMLGFAVLLLVAGSRLLRPQTDTGTACRIPSTGKVNWRRCMSRAVPVGLGVGVLTGLFGVGGGFLIVPALVVALGLDSVSAIATSVAIVAINSASALFAHAGTSGLDTGSVIAFAVPAAVAAALAGRLRLDAARTQRWFAYLLLVTAVAVTAATAIPLLR
ncbi:sulfite exporter TauE/SafE family protein [Skermania piniformis]|uniref:Probable membrane transporter protein n=1 Tax=Skermania pinensis TaxID=39122 RepID=A0ABX8SA85_9ACTN|nr:sulfite exporter TauE/SafE family protein [Skermania piniformis]QXQ12631.1 sulfite exporter TauE/SafE family protein [Skermania piniformis]